MDTHETLLADASVSAHRTVLHVCEMLSAYPAITNTEFQEAGKALEYAYNASVAVNDWTDVKRTNEEFLIQRKSLVHASHASKSGVTRDKEQDEKDLDEIEQEDKESLQRNPSESLQEISVEYSIVLSPTYQVPVLWFSSRVIPVTRADALDRVYEMIVAPASRPGLRQIGVLGGISMAEHPISGLPAFFIHPCRTQEALEVVRPGKGMSPIEYMMLWFGIIGTPVGLSLPLEIAESISTQRSSGCDHAKQPETLNRLGL